MTSEDYQYIDESGRWSKRNKQERHCRVAIGIGFNLPWEVLRFLSTPTTHGWIRLPTRGQRLAERRGDRRGEKDVERLEDATVGGVKDVKVSMEMSWSRWVFPKTGVPPNHPF